MSADGTYTTASVLRDAAASHGFTETDASVHTTFDNILFSLACGTIDAASLVAHGRKTIQPEDFASLAKLYDMFSRPLSSSMRSSRQVRSRVSKKSRQSRQSGGTTNTGSYYSPSDVIDQRAYLYEDTGEHGGSSTDVGGDYARTGLMYHSIVGGASNSWGLSMDTVTKILRDYRNRFSTDLRVTDPAKMYMKSTLQTNMDAVLHRALSSKKSSKGKSKSLNLTAAALRRAADGHVLMLVPA